MKAVPGGYLSTSDWILVPAAIRTASAGAVYVAPVRPAEVEAMQPYPSRDCEEGFLAIKGRVSIQTVYFMLCNCCQVGSASLLRVRANPRGRRQPIAAG